MNKNDSKKISIIVPIYNVEKYLDKCLESLLNQTYKNIEIVCVEDCSTDSSRDVLNKYRNNKKIKIVLNKKNSGLSFSRNEGLKHATGDYIGFVDSDDYVDADYYEKLLLQIIKDKSDVAVSDIKVVYEEEKRTILNKAYNVSKDSLGFINNGLAASACNKLFKKEVIIKNKFAEGKVNEDLAVIIPILANCDNISYVDDSYYYYIQRNNSIQNSKFSDKRFDIISGVDLTLERIKGCNCYDLIKDAIIYNQIIVLLIYVIPKEKNIIRRALIIKKFIKLTSKYNIRQNKYFWSFLDCCGRKHALYYKVLFKAACNHFYMVSSLIILLYGVIRRIFVKKVIHNVTDASLLKKAKKQSKYSNYNINVSVVIPNYNYASFLSQRLDSILSQKFKFFEIIILDDCSKDDSKEVINKYSKLLGKYIKIKTIFNDVNSGSAFKQWKKGFELATGDYVWIAEADDYCNKRFISNVIKPIINNKDVVISYSDTAFIDADGYIKCKSIKPEIDIQKSGHWNKNYINDGKSETENFACLNCTIANVSSALIKNGKYSDYFELSGNYKQAGDWLFYVNVMNNGLIAFTNKALNYYRVHGSNVSSVMKHEQHIKEILNIYKYVNNEFKISKAMQKKQNDRIDFLKKCWGVK